MHFVYKYFILWQTMHATATATTTTNKTTPATSASQQKAAEFSLSLPFSVAFLLFLLHAADTSACCATHDLHLCPSANPHSNPCSYPYTYPSTHALSLVPLPLAVTLLHVLFIEVARVLLQVGVATVPSTGLHFKERQDIVIFHLLTYVVH